MFEITQVMSYMENLFSRKEQILFYADALHQTDFLTLCSAHLSNVGCMLQVS